MKQLFHESQIAVAEEDGKIAGFAGNRGSFITWLFVHPSFRRRGVATALVKDLLRKLDQPITLNVALTNGPALSLYHRMGFKVEREFVGDFNGRPCKVARLHYAAAA
jgi:ribosomal protein S18 acetylase RimI-like enzyme